MNLLQETKDRVAKKHGYECWHNALESFRKLCLTFTELKVMENEVSQEYAKNLCEKQKEICSVNAGFITIERYVPEIDLSVYEPYVDKESILNAPFPNELKD